MLGQGCGLFFETAGGQKVFDEKERTQRQGQPLGRRRLHERKLREAFADLCQREGGRAGGGDLSLQLLRVGSQQKLRALQKIFIGAQDQLCGVVPLQGELLVHVVQHGELRPRHAGGEVQGRGDEFVAADVVFQRGAVFGGKILVPYADAAHKDDLFPAADAVFDVVALDKKGHGQPVRAHAARIHAAVPPGGKVGLGQAFVCKQRRPFRQMQPVPARGEVKAVVIPARLVLHGGSFQRQHPPAERRGGVLWQQAADQPPRPRQRFKRAQHVVVHQQDVAEPARRIGRKGCRRHPPGKAARTAQIVPRQQGIEGRRGQAQGAGVVADIQVQPLSPCGLDLRRLQKALHGRLGKALAAVGADDDGDARFPQAGRLRRRIAGKDAPLRLRF